MAESTNTYSANQDSVTIQLLSALPPVNHKVDYVPMDPAALGQSNLFTAIKVVGIGSAPLSGDYGQGLPAGQAFTPVTSSIDTTVLIDTGSYETVLPRYLFDAVLTDDQLKEYPAATFSYSISEKGGTGVWVPMQIALTTVDGSTVVTTIPVIVPTDGTKYWMMGIGFNIGRGVPGSLPDTSTAGNAFLNIGQMADGSISRGYVIDGSGVHLGLDAADVGDGWALQKLQPSPRAAPAGAPADWQAATISGTLDYPSTTAGTPGLVGQVPAGNLLMDTGLSKTFIKTTDPLPTPPDGTKVSFNLFGTDGQVGYDYTLGSSDPQAPTSDGQALTTGLTKPGAGTFVNTGQHFLSGFDYLYDADHGYLGIRPNTPPNPNDRFTALLSASGAYAVPDGFVATVPLYLAADTQLSVPGTATLSGGVEGPGTLTLTSGTLMLSGASDTARLALAAGTVLSAPDGLVLSSLEADGSAVITVPAGKVVQVTGSLTTGPGFVSQGVLTVTGGGTLQIGTLSIPSGQAIPWPASSTLPPDVGAGLGAFATVVAASVAATGERAYSYHTIGAGAGSPDVNPAQGSAFTDCSGWVSFALDSVAPLHQAVAAAHRTEAQFNLGKIATSDGGSVTLAEATEWNWARAEVLTDLFQNATGPNGYAKVMNFANLRPGDLIAYAFGIYADPTGDISTNPGLIEKSDTGHTMIVTAAPVRVTDPALLAQHANLAANAVAIYAVPVVDSSDKIHFLFPQGDTRTYDRLPTDDPRTGVGGDHGGGLGTGTIWFAVDASGQPIQFCLGASDGWQPPSATAEAASIAAVRLTDTIDLGATDLVGGQLVVNTYPNANPALNGVNYAIPEHLTGAGGLLVTGGGTLPLYAGNDFTGAVEVAGGTTLALRMDSALGDATNQLTLDAGAILKINATLTLAHAVSVATGTAVLDLSGSLAVISGPLSVAQGATLELVSSTPGGRLELAPSVRPTGTILVDGGVQMRLTGAGSVPGTIALAPGAGLDVAASCAVSNLLMTGTATVSVAAGAVLTVSSIVAQGDVGTLTVSGQGTLAIGSGASLLAGQTLYTGTLSQFDGQSLTNFRPGDVLDITGLVATPGQAGVTGGVTARYDNTTGLLAIARAGTTASVQLAPGLKLAADGTPEAFTIRTDGSGGTLVQLSAATGSGASDALGATALRAAGGPDGAGVIVGVISVSGNALGGLAQDIVNGTLPQDTAVLSDPAGPSTDEGREMAQMVHAIAPGAAIRLAYANDTGTGQDLANAINLLVQNGARVIVDDLSDFDDRLYQAGGPVADAIANALAHNVTVVTSAGNSGANYYEGQVALTQTTLPGIPEPVWAYDFGRGTGRYLEELDLKPNQTGNVDLTLGWTQPGQNAGYRLGMAVFTRNADGSFTKTADAPGPQAAGDAATLNLSIANSQNGGTFFVAVYATSPVAVPDQNFKLIVHHEGGITVFADPDANHGTGVISGHALNPDEITVGAVYYGGAGAATPVNEAFSSPGAMPGSGINLLQADGTSGGAISAKPDVSGVDGIHNDVSGADASFYGTSAAAPTVAAVAALMLQVNPDLTPAEVKAMLKQSAVPTNSTLQGGAGLVRADQAVALAVADAARPKLAFTDTTTGVQGTIKMDPAAAGAPSYLQWQYIAQGTDNMAFATDRPNVFIHGGSGDDAIAVSSGQNVIDGGTGSNFMVGGTGNDTFFTDARGGGDVWNTISNFHSGDAATLWGFDPTVSSYTWDDQPAGAAGYTGATLRANIDGNGAGASITFAGMGVEQAKSMVHSTGEFAGGSGKYLYFLNQGV